jgi:hypothetical protein
MSGILCATVCFFFNYFGSIFTQFRPGQLKNEKKVAENRFLDEIMATNPGTK